MRDYQGTKADVVIAIVGWIVVDVGKTTIVGVATDQAVVSLELKCFASLNYPLTED